MKVLLTGANGFVGSHVLEALRARNLATALLLRPTSDLQFIRGRLPGVEVRHGSITDPASLAAAMADVTHVIHCAGLTKALRAEEFTAVNQAGTAHVVAAVNARGDQVRRLVHLSSLAACGPATTDAPARETDTPHPVSAYGRSKLGGEAEVREKCRAPSVILRPPGVYGPRDREFLRLFESVRRGWAPRIAGGGQPLSLVFVADLALALVACVDHPAAAGQTYHVAADEVVTGWRMAEAVAEALGRRVRPLPLPGWLVRLSCAAAGWGARVTGRASVLAHDKHRELLAPGWVCDPGRLRRDLGLTCPTRVAAGVPPTLRWYQEHGWLGRGPSVATPHRG